PSTAGARPCDASGSAIRQPSAGRNRDGVPRCRENRTHSMVFARQARASMPSGEPLAPKPSCDCSHATWPDWGTSDWCSGSCPSFEPPLCGEGEFGGYKGQRRAQNEPATEVFDLNGNEVRGNL